MAKIDTSFMTKTPEKTITFGVAHTDIAHIVKYPVVKSYLRYRNSNVFVQVAKPTTMESRTRRLTYVVISVL